MAYKSKRRAAPRRRTTKKPARSARAKGFRGAVKRVAKSVGRAASRAIRIELVQAAPRELSPVTQMLLERGKVTVPKKARF